MLVFLLLGLLFWLISFILPGHYAPWTTAHQEFLAFLGGFFLIISVLLNSGDDGRIKIPSGFVFALLFSLLPIAQYIAGISFYFGDAFLASIYILGFFSMMCVGYNLSFDPRVRVSVIAMLAIALIIASVISGWIALQQWALVSNSFWVSSLSKGSRPFANLGQPNQLAVLLSLGLAGVLFLYERYSLNSISSSVLALFLIFCLVLTQSRTAWVMALFFLCFWGAKFHAGPRRLSWFGVAAWMCVFVFLIAIIPFLSELLLFVEVSTALERARATERWGLYYQFIKAVWHGPLWGYGWQQVGVAQVAMASIFSSTVFTMYTHNFILDLVVWNGPLLGGVVVLWCVVGWARMLYVARSADDVFIAIAVSLILIYGLLEYPHAYAYFLLLLGLLIGLFQSNHRCRLYFAPKWCVMLFLIGSVGVFLVVWRDYKIIEEDYRLMRFEKNRVGSVRAEQPYPEVVFLTQMQERVKYLRLSAQEIQREEIEGLYIASRRFHYPETLLKHAKVLALHDESSEAYKEIIVILRVHGAQMACRAIQEFEAGKNVYAEPLIGRLRNLKEELTCELAGASL